MSYIIIDGNSLLYAGQHAKPLSVDNQPTHAIFYFLKTLYAVLKKYPEYKVPLVVWDRRAQFRFDILAEYKGKRGKTPDQIKAKEEIKTQYPLLFDILSSAGVAQAYSEAFEADDVAGYLVRKAKKSHLKSLLITGDEDWIQLVNENTVWNDPRRGGDKYCSFDTFFEFTGYKTPAGFLQGKAIKGDASDNITGVSGLGDKASKEIMMSFGDVKSLYTFYKTSEAFSSENLPESLLRFKKKITDFLNNDLETFRRNLELMNLLTSSRDDQIKSGFVMNRGKPDKDTFVDLCGNLSFASIVSRRDDWFNTLSKRKL